MKNKSFLFALMLATLFLSTIASCKKDESNAVQKQNNETAVSGNEDPFSENSTRGSVKPHNHDNATHDIPRCIKEMMNDPEFEFYDFENMVHFHELDTSGIYTYAVPCSFMETEILFVGVVNNQIVMRYAISMPMDFDYEFYYNNHRNAYIYVYSYDYSEEFFEGNLNVFNQTFRFCWVNPNLSEVGMTTGLPLPPLQHWKDMNICERIATGAELVFDLGIAFAGSSGGPLGWKLAWTLGTLNGMGWELARQKICK